MKSKLIALMAGLAIGIAAVLGAGVVQAEKPSTPAPKHMHFFTTASGEVVWVGPNVCEIPMNDQGWQAYHVKVHFGMANENLQLGIELCD